MEGINMEGRNEALRSPMAIRCAKAALLLYSLKSSSDLSSNLPNKDQNEENKLMTKEIGDLKVKLARERIRSKKIKLCGLMEVILQVMMILSFFTVLLVLAFKLLQIDTSNDLP